MKNCEAVAEWSEAIRNHFWFVCQNCDGDEEKLKVILTESLLFTNNKFHNLVLV